MNLEDLPLEIIVNIIKYTDVETRARLLYVSKTIGQEAKRQLQFLPVSGPKEFYYRDRIELFEERNVRIEKIYTVDKTKNALNNTEHQAENEYLRRVDWDKWNEKEQCWNRHRKHGPAVMCWHPNKNKESFYWCKDGEDYIRENDQPDIQTWHENGNIQCEGWHKNGELNRNRNPNWVIWGKNGNKKIEEYHEGHICTKSKTSKWSETQNKWIVKRR